MITAFPTRAPNIRNKKRLNPLKGKREQKNVVLKQNQSARFITEAPGLYHLLLKAERSVWPDDMLQS
jgi:hypothetical protein